MTLEVNRALLNNLWSSHPRQTRTCLETVEWRAKCSRFQLWIPFPHFLPAVWKL